MIATLLSWWFESSSGSDRLLASVVLVGDEDKVEGSSFVTAAEEEAEFAAAPTANDDDDEDDDFIGDIKTLATTTTTTTEGEARRRPSTKTTSTRPPRRRSDDGLNCYSASFDADPETTMPSLATKTTPASPSSLIPPPDSENIRAAIRDAERMLDAEMRLYNFLAGNKDGRNADDDEDYDDDLSLSQFYSTEWDAEPHGDMTASIEASGAMRSHPPRAAMDMELASSEMNVIFTTLLAEERGGGDTISKSRLRWWDEIASLIEDGLLEEDEFVALWEGALGDARAKGGLDYAGFLRFGNALEDLFEFEAYASDDDDDHDDEVVDPGEDAVTQAKIVPQPMIMEEDLPPGVLFAQLTNEKCLVGKAELQRWGELNAMLKVGVLTVDELNALFEKAPGARDMLDEEGFCAFYDSIRASGAMRLAELRLSAAIKRGNDTLKLEGDLDQVAERELQEAMAHLEMLRMTQKKLHDVRVAAATSGTRATEDRTNGE
jgi:hypothetical protein